MENNKQEATRWQLAFCSPTQSNYVNVREEAGTGSKIKGRVTKGTVVEWVDEIKNKHWVQISLYEENEEPLIGWVHTEFVRFTEIQSIAITELKNILDNCSEQSNEQEIDIDLPLYQYPTMSMTDTERDRIAHLMQWLITYITHRPELPEREAPDPDTATTDEDRVGSDKSNKDEGEEGKGADLNSGE